MRKALVALLILVMAWVAAWQVADRPAPPQPADATAPAARLDPARLRSLEIAPRTEALTFARFLHNGAPHLMLVASYDGGQVAGIDLQSALPGSAGDPIAVFNVHGYAALESLAGPEARADADALLLPFAGTASQIAVGINYPSHGEEVAVRDSFLFPKQVEATPHRAEVPARDHLLDYEIELGFVPLEPLRRDAMPQFVGLVLASDYTDRAMLMRHVKLTDVSSGEGFTQGKSAPGFMPVGNLLVIPKDYERFYRTLHLELWCNGEKRQDAQPSRMSWDLRRIVSETFARENRAWTWNGQQARLPVENGAVPARTLILSGTPSGVIYRQPSARQLFAGVSETVFTLKWGRRNAVVEPFLRDAHASGRYLKPGDEVAMRADRLGVIVNRIVN